MAVSALVNEQRDPSTARNYRQLVADRPVLVSFVTIGEMRYGALKAGWGELRTRGLERSLSQLVVVQPDDELVRTCASRLELELVSDDAVFQGVEGLSVLRLRTN